MSENQPLLNSRLIPRVQQAKLIERTPLLELLDTAWNYPLTLVCAPAGFGKTTLLAQWLYRQMHSVVWLTLEASDTLEVRFWQYLIATVQTAYPQFGSAALHWLNMGTPPSAEGAITLLLNELAALNEPVALILDDYHVLPVMADVHAGMTYFVSHLPPNVHLIVASRSDPILPLARFRARGLLLEIRAEHLRFSLAEADAFLREKMKLPIEAEDTERLLIRTEGWIAGLHMAALSLQGQERIREFIARFSGDHRFVLDYLNDEVLGHQPSDMQDFLLYTSVVQRLNAPLCAALTGRADSQQILEQLEQKNMFIVALDEQRFYYRYHQLFLDLLRRRLSQQPDLTRDLHRRAAHWYATYDCPYQAVEHALAGEDYELAVNLVESGSWMQSIRRGDAPTIIPLVKRFPDAVIQRHPLVGINQASALIAATKYQEAELLLNQLEAAQVIQDDWLRGCVATIRSAVAVLRHQPDLISYHAEEALRLLPDGLAEMQFWAAFSLAHSYRQHGRSTDMLRVLDSLLPRLPGDDNSVRVVSLANYAEQMRVQGKLRAAYERHCDLIAQHKDKRVFYIAVSYIFGAEILLEWNRLDDALAWVQQGVSFASVANSQELLLWGTTMLATVHSVRGEGDAALFALARASAAAGDIVYFQRHAAMCKACVLLAQGDTAAFNAWIEARQFSPQATVSYLEEAEYQQYARWLLLNGEASSALDLLDRLMAQAQVGGRLNDAIQAQVLQVVAWQQMNQPERAQRLLIDVLRLALPEGYRRVFMDKGRELADVLMQVASQITLPSELANWAHHTLSTLPEHINLTDPLTDRELEVLRLIAAGCGNQAIADRMVVSINTIKTHVKNLYQKFDVNNRVALLEQARAVHLIP